MSDISGDLIKESPKSEGKIDQLSNYFHAKYQLIWFTQMKWSEVIIQQKKRKNESMCRCN
uniref:Uncharacterized protein n=1 Tax=Tetranychus urticae TaxID=32264 RepID=T1KE82_TETUR